VSSIDVLLASYLDLARHLDPLRHPYEAPDSVRHAIGRFDVPWLKAQVAALRAIANAVEDLEIDDRDDEIDRTMLIDTIRADALRLEHSADSSQANPTVPIAHATTAIFELMIEEFNGETEAALRARLSALPELLEAVCSDRRAIAEPVREMALLEIGGIDDALDEASERLDDAAVQPAVVAVADCRAALNAATAGVAVEPLPERGIDAMLSTLVNEPVGHRGALRILELRRAGAEQSLATAAAELGPDDGLVLARMMSEERFDFSEGTDLWDAEWERVATELKALGFDDVDTPAAMGLGLDFEDPTSVTVVAIRSHAAVWFEHARASQPRSVRRLLIAPGLVAGWGRTVSALLRPTAVAGDAARRLMLSRRALIESAAAEVDLLLQSGSSDLDALQQRVEQITGLPPAEARQVVVDAAASPFEALAAAFAHEAWQSWYAEEGGDPAAFLRKALRAGGLAVPLARWALAGDGADPRPAQTSIHLAD